MPGLGVGLHRRRRAGSYPSIVTDGTCSLRQVIRDDYLCTDITLTATGFDGTEDVDWENLLKSSGGWSPQKIEEAKPSDLTVLWTDDYASISFTDNSDGKAEHEIYEAIGDGDYTLVTTLEKGVTSYNNYTWQNASMNFKIRAKGGSYFSTYTDVVNISTPLVFKVTTTTTPETKTIQSLTVKNDYTVNIDWGDASNQDVTGANSNISHQFAIPGTYFIKYGGDRNFISVLYMYNTPQFNGDLSKWKLPDCDNLNSVIFRLYGCSFSGDLTNMILPAQTSQFYIGNNNFTGKCPNKLPYGNSGLEYVVYGNNFTGINLKEVKYGVVSFQLFPNLSKIPYSEISDFLDNLLIFYTTNSALIYGNSGYHLEGFFNGEIEGGQLDERIVAIKALFAAKSKICNFYLNEYDPFDKAKIAFTWDGSYLGCYTGSKYLINQGIKNTYYVQTGNIDTALMTTSAQLLELDGLGVDLQAHSHAHTKYTLMTDANLRLDMEAVNTFFTGLGLATPVHDAYPFGTIDDAKKLIVAEYRLTGRTIDQNLMIPNYKNVDKFAIASINIDHVSGMTEEIAKSYIDEAVAKKCAITFYSHSYSEDGSVGVKKSLLDYIIGYINTVDADIVDIPELYALLP